MRNAPAATVRGIRVGAVLAAVVLLGACGITDNRGVELGHLRDLARRVEGGGVECPLAVPASAIRPTGVEPDAPIVPLRNDLPGSEGTIGGDDLPTDDSVRIMCRWSVQGHAVTLVVVGVDRGRAIASFAPEWEARDTTGEVSAFLNVNARLPVGEAAVLPGEPPAAFTRVRASHGDVALILSVDTVADDAPAPDADGVDEHAVAIARALAD